MFVIKSYYRKELALLYFPDSANARAACQNLRRWLHENHFRDALHKKILSPKTVRQIIDLLGEP